MGDLEQPSLRGDQQPSGEDMYKLGLAYSTGQGAPLDFVQAHKWFNLAAVNGFEEAKSHRKEVADHMTSADIAAAQREAREWLRTNTPAKRQAA